MNLLSESWSNPSKARLLRYIETAHVVVSRCSHFLGIISASQDGNFTTAIDPWLHLRSECVVLSMPRMDRCDFKHTFRVNNYTPSRPKGTTRQERSRVRLVSTPVWSTCSVWSRFASVWTRWTATLPATSRQDTTRLPTRWRACWWRWDGRRSSLRRVLQWCQSQVTLLLETLKHNMAILHLSLIYALTMFCRIRQADKLGIGSLSLLVLLVVCSCYWPDVI